MFSSTVCKCLQNIPDVECVKAASSIQSGQQQKTPDGPVYVQSGISLVHTVLHCVENSELAIQIYAKSHCRIESTVEGATACDTPPVDQ